MSVRGASEERIANSSSNSGDGIKMDKGYPVVA